MDKILAKVSLLKSGSSKGGLDFDAAAGNTGVPNRVKHDGESTLITLKESHEAASFLSAMGSSRERSPSLHTNNYDDLKISIAIKSAIKSPPRSPSPSLSPSPSPSPALPRSTKKERGEDALKLWKEWAADSSTMGQLPKEDGRKNEEFALLEKKCTNLSRQAERRLVMSASLRGGSLTTGQSLTGYGSSGQAMGWAVKEIKREQAYTAVRLMGESERDLRGSSSILAGNPITPQIPKSRALLNSMINGNGKKGTTRPSSASPYLSNSRPSSSLSIHRRHDPSANQSIIARSDGITAHQLQESNFLRNKLDEAHAAVKTQSQVERQLREAIDLLRARLHGQSTREVDHERRLQQHTRLEPLFDRLSEEFSYTSPEQVIERLQLLEDDRLGTFGSLLDTQDEVNSLQSAVKAADQRVVSLRASMEAERLKSSNDLALQNEALRSELQSTEALNRRLQARQQQLVDLQTQVLHLWGKCQNDPLFQAANAPSGDALGESNSNIGDTDPLSAIALVEEYLQSKSPELAAKHYVQVSRVANRVWTNHLKHKPHVRGKVVETFEQLSLLADVMARSNLRSRNDLEESRRNEKELRESLDFALREKRKLEVELSSVKSKAREGGRSSVNPSSNPALLTPSQLAPRRNQRPQSALISRIPSSANTLPAAASISGLGVSRATHGNHRPQSARPQSAITRSFARVRSSTPSSTQLQVTLRDHPPGEHWGQLTRGNSKSSIAK